MIRAGVPKTWKVGDKTGRCANGATNDIAIIRPPGRAPILWPFILWDQQLHRTTERQPSPRWQKLSPNRSSRKRSQATLGKLSAEFRRCATTSNALSVDS